MTADYSVSLGKPDGTFFKLTSAVQREFLPGPGNGFGWGHIAMDQHVHDDKLVLKCVVEVRGDPKTPVEATGDGLPEELAFPNDEDAGLMGCVRRAASAVPADFAVVCDGESFPCHRFVLAVRSSVFAGMLAHDNMEEAKTGRVVVEDVGKEAMAMLLHFMYTDECDGLDEQPDKPGIKRYDAL